MRAEIGTVDVPIRPKLADSPIPPDFYADTLKVTVTADVDTIKFGRNLAALLRQAADIFDQFGAAPEHSRSTRTMAEPVDLDAVAQLLADLPRGPWRVEYFGDQGYPQRICNDAAIIVADTHQGSTGLRPTPEFIAQARTLVPRMADEIRQLRAEVARLRIHGAEVSPSVAVVHDRTYTPGPGDGT